MATLPRDTERLGFRHLGEADLDALVALYADPEVVRFVGRYDRAQLREWLAENRKEVETRGHGRIAIVSRPDGEFLGRTGLKRRAQFDEVEVDWSLAPAARGRGIATEAARAVLEWGFESLDVAYVTAMIDPENQPSIAVAERLGMTVLRRDELDGESLLVYSIAR
ncbi:MAG TPA: GNAT family N-acetyltransferase [Solirubrobacterales bacterium]|nr:GNAT family N-acetyltransferase [Solirubrobacterales bacterium]